MVRTFCLPLLMIVLGTSVAFAAETTSLLPELGKHPVKIVCLGDSVTGVYYHTGGRRAYPEMLEIALKKLAPGAEVTVVNAGISGQSTQHGLARLDRDVLSHKPQVVTVSFGLNDVARNSMEAFRENLTETIRRCREANVKVVLCTPNMVINTSARPIEKIGAYCDVIRALAAEHKTGLCDQFAVGTVQQKKDSWDWRLTLSDEIHPNMAGHKRMAEELCFAITGQRVSLEDVPPPTPALAKTWSTLSAGKPLKILAMPPFDELIAPALKTQFPEAKLEVVAWPTAGKTLSEIEQAAKTTVRAMKPDLVLIAVPRESTANNDEAFVKSYSWIMNWSLSFGQQEWDCLVVHPSVTVRSESPGRDDLIRRLVHAQHLHLLDQRLDSPVDAAKSLATFLSGDRPNAAASGK